MTKAAVKEREEPSLPLAGMKDVTPKATKKTSVTKAKPTATKAVAVHDPAKAAAAKARTPSTLLSVIMQAVSDPRCDTGKMRELLAMQREIDQEEARRAFTVDYMALTEDLPAITADRTIEIRKKGPDGERTGAIIQSTPYVTFNAMMKVLKQPLKRHGFSLSYSTEPSADGSRLIVWVYLDHVRGHQRKTAFPLPAETSGSKNNVQGWGSAQSYGMRYGTRALLNIISRAPEDADTDGLVAPQIENDSQDQADSVPDTITPAQVTDLEKEIKACGVALAKFLEYFEIKKISDLPIGKFAQAVQQCRDYAQRSKK